MNKKFIAAFIGALLIFLNISSKIFAQQPDRCGTEEYLNQYEKQFPGFKEQVRQVRNEAIQWSNAHPTALRNIATIPVVVHVVYHTTAENIPDDQVRSQIDVLNEDYQKVNPDTAKAPAIFKPLIGDVQMEFCLAAVDPNGNPTSGIVRTYTDNLSFDLSDSMKYTNEGGDDGWPSTKYLNIWVCNLTPPKLGYTTLPSGPGIHKNDGVVVLYKAFGREGKYLEPRYNLGRTCTHEVGHWFGLVHTWGDDGGLCPDDGGNDDDIADTPPQADANYGCVEFPHITCNNNGDMSMNYMDYSDDRCMYMFTIDQAKEMLGVLNGVRKSILTSTAGCNSNYVYQLDARMNYIVSPNDTVKAQSFNPQIQIMNKGQENLTSLHIEYQIDGQDVQSYDFSGDLPSGNVANITLPLAFTGEGGHVFTAWCSQPNGQKDEYLSNDTLQTTFDVTSVVAKNTLYISFDSPTIMTLTVLNPGAPDMNLLIVNLLGQAVFQKTESLINQTSFNFDFTHMATGIYLVQGKVGYYYTKTRFLFVNPGQ